jgi:hypothetical protein
MAFLDQPINANELPESDRSFDPLPAGWYDVQITGAELRQTKSGTGQYIAVRYDVTGPTHQGRVVFGNLNIRNANPDAERIGRQQLGELMRSIGLAQVTDTDQLIGHQLQIKLRVREASGGYDASNDVSGFRATSNNATPPRQTAQQPIREPTTAQATASRAPWARK